MEQNPKPKQKRLSPIPDGKCFKCGYPCDSRKFWLSHNKLCVDEYNSVLRQRQISKVREFYHAKVEKAKQASELEQENQLLVQELNEVYQRLEQLELQNNSTLATIVEPRPKPVINPLS